MIKSRAAGTADLDGTFSRRYTAARAAACRHDTHVRASETPFAPGLGRFVPYAGAVDAAARVVVRITKGSGAHAAWIPAMCCTWGGASAFPRQPPPRMPPAGGPSPPTNRDPHAGVDLHAGVAPSEGRSSVATSLRSLPRGPPPGALSISSTRANVALRSSAICLTLCWACTALPSIVERPWQWTS